MPSNIKPAFPWIRLNGDIARHFLFLNCQSTFKTLSLGDLGGVMVQESTMELTLGGFKENMRERPFLSDGDRSLCEVLIMDEWRAAFSSHGLVYAYLQCASVKGR